MLTAVFFPLIFSAHSEEVPKSAPQTLAHKSAPAPSRDKGPRMVLFVKDEVKLIEMPSLQRDVASQGSYSIDAQFSALDSFGGRVTDDGHTLGDPGNSDFNEEPFTAMQVYGFKVQPGETLKLNLDCELSGKVVMSFYLPKNPSIMTSQLKRANQTPRPLRSRYMELTNITRQPYEAIVILKGQPNYPYRLALDRGPAKN